MGEKLEKCLRMVEGLEEYLKKVLPPQSVLQKKIHEDTMKEDWEENFKKGLVIYPYSVIMLSTGHSSNYSISIHGSVQASTWTKNTKLNYEIFLLYCLNFSSVPEDGSGTDEGREDLGNWNVHGLYGSSLLWIRIFCTLYINRPQAMSFEKIYYLVISDFLETSHNPRTRSVSSWICQIPNCRNRRRKKAGDYCWTSPGFIRNFKGWREKVWFGLYWCG